MAKRPTKPPRLSEERRRALELLASSPVGANAGLLVFAHGFDRRVLDCLVEAGLAAAEREVVVAGDKPVEIIRIKITNAGRRAIEGPGNKSHPCAISRGRLGEGVW